LHSLPSPRKDNTADPSSKADYCTGKLLLKGRTQGRGIGGDEIDVESPRTLQKGISEESAHEEDRQMTPLGCHPRYLPEQGILLKGCKDGRDALIHPFTLREGGRNVNELSSRPENSLTAHVLQIYAYRM
jgi:hypothetical protein